jgi:DNA-binding transcriptional ArsR family regulator
MGKNQKRGRNGRGERGNRRTTPGLADDQLYRVLAARPRRRLLYYLDDVEQSTVNELAAVLVGWEHTERGGMATEAEYDRTETALRHSHLPALADAGLVTDDTDTDHVTVASLDDEISELVARSIGAEAE